MKTPRYNLDDVPYCQIGMGAEAARLNGYKHGFQNVNTRGVCILTIGTDEYDAWQAGYTEGEADADQVFRVYIYLGEKEWGNEIMAQIAAEYAAEHAERPLIVSVHEHAGWHLSYLYGAPRIADGTICGTANDGASLAPAVLEFGKSIGKVEILQEVRR
jgi:hypothetical protein